MKNSIKALFFSFFAFYVSAETSTPKNVGYSYSIKNSVHAQNNRAQSRSYRRVGSQNNNQALSKNYVNSSIFSLDNLQWGLSKTAKGAWWGLSKTAKGAWWLTEKSPDILLTAGCAAGIVFGMSAYNNGFDCAKNQFGDYAKYLYNQGLSEDVCGPRIQGFASDTLDPLLQSGHVGLRCAANNAIGALNFVASNLTTAVPLALSAFTLKKILCSPVVHQVFQTAAQVTNCVLDIMAINELSHYQQQRSNFEKQ